MGLSEKNYLIITPCKNEQENLPHLIESIASQTFMPFLWLILDDGSMDRTPLIILEAERKYSWIKHINFNGGQRDRGLHLSEIMNEGFKHAILYCKKRKIECDYFGNIDADITVEIDFFEKLIDEFEKDQKLGIVSGGIILTVNGKLQRVEGLPSDEPSGGDMLIRKKCIEECGGIPISYSWDSVLKAKAKLRGWSAKRFENNLATEIRDVHNAEGYWKGYLHSGKSDYYINFNPLHVILKSVIITIKRPYFNGIAYLVGYFKSWIKRECQIDDAEIKDYFWNKFKNKHLF